MRGREHAHDLAHGPHPVLADAELVDDLGDHGAHLVLAELLGQVVGDDGGLGPLLGGLLVAAGVAERLGGLAALLGLAGEHPEDVLVGQLALGLAATSALVTAVRTIRSVDERTSSRALIEVVRSVRSRSFRVPMEAIVAAWGHGTPPGFRPLRAHPEAWGRAGRTALAGLGLGAATGAATLAWSAGVEVRAFTVRRVEVPVLPPGHEPLKSSTSPTCT